MMTAPCFVVLQHGYQFDTSSLFASTLSFRNRMPAHFIPLMDYDHLPTKGKGLLRHDSERLQPQKLPRVTRALKILQSVKL